MGADFRSPFPIIPEEGYRTELGLDRDEVPGVLLELERFCLAREVPPKIMYRLQVGADELITNSMMHGSFGARAEPSVALSVALESAAISVVVEDNGHPYNPLRDAPSPNLELEPTDMPIGGLGIHLVKSMIPELSYLRDSGRNYVLLRQPL